MQARATIYDVARAANVSIATVSRVINGLHTGNPAIKGRVLRLAKELNYYPNASARRLVKGSTENMGFVVRSARPADGYYGDILQGAEEEARKSNYNLYFSTIYPTLSALGMDIPKGVLENSIDGLIYVGEMSRDLFRQIKGTSIPLVLVNSYIEGEDVECVMCDNFQSSYKAVKWLIGLGHRSIACIACGNEGIPSIKERADGYRQALRDSGISFEEGLIQVGGYSPEDGYRAMGELLKLPQRPTAVFGTVDEVAVGAIKCAKGAGLRVPEDLSVVGVNDLDIAQLCEPPLTTVRIFRKEMGRVAVHRLLELIREPGKRPTRTDVLCEFVERESCTRVG